MMSSTYDLGNPAFGDNDSRLNRTPQREILSFVIDMDGNTHLVETSLRDLMNDINTAIVELDGGVVPEIHSASTSGTSASKSDKSANEGKQMRRASFIRSVDVHGNSTAGHHFNIETYVSLLKLRDLRRLDFNFNPNEEKSFLIRRHVVLFAMVSCAPKERNEPSATSFGILITLSLPYRILFEL